MIRSSELENHMENTLDSLDSVITTLQKENYLFLPLFKESVMNGNCIPKWDN